MSGTIGENSTRREFLKQAAVGEAVALMSPAAHVLGANDREEARAWQPSGLLKGA